MRGRLFVVSRSEVVPTTDTERAAEPPSEHRQQRDACSQLPSINTPTGERPRARWTCGSATTHLDFGVHTVERCLASFFFKKKKAGRLDFCSSNHALMSHETAFVCERSIQHALVHVAASPRTECSKIEKVSEKPEKQSLQQDGNSLQNSFCVHVGGAASGAQHGPRIVSSKAPQQAQTHSLQQHLATKSETSPKSHRHKPNRIA